MSAQQERDKRQGGMDYLRLVVVDSVYPYNRQIPEPKQVLILLERGPGVMYVLVPNSEVAMSGARIVSKQQTRIGRTTTELIHKLTRVRKMI